MRDEALNLGVFLHSPEEKYLGCVLTDDFRRVRQFHPKADVGLLRALQQHFDEEIDRHGDDLETYIRAMQESYSNLIQVSDLHPCLLLDPQAEIQTLFTRYVGMPSGGHAQEDTRLRTKQRLTSALVRAGTWERIEKRIPAAQWTRKGDPFVFDYGYRVAANGVKPGSSHSLDLPQAPSPRSRVKLIHALSLKRDSTLAKELVFTMDQVRKRAPADLTAVVEARADGGNPSALYTQQLLEENAIAIQPLAGIDGFAESVRHETAF